jgi:hypothetical protein
MAVTRISPCFIALGAKSFDLVCGGLQTFDNFTYPLFFCVVSPSAQTHDDVIVLGHSSLSVGVLECQ